MAKKCTVKNMRGRNRPELSCDTLGYPPSVGDKEWQDKHKKFWVDNGDGTWTEK